MTQLSLSMGAFGPDLLEIHHGELEICHRKYCPGLRDAMIHNMGNPLDVATADAAHKHISGSPIGSLTAIPDTIEGDGGDPMGSEPEVFGGLHPIFYGFWDIIINFLLFILLKFRI